MFNLNDNIYVSIIVLDLYWFRYF